MTDPILKVICEDLGLIHYKDAWDYQLKYFNEVLTAKENGLRPVNHFLFCEHTDVFTLGKNGFRKNLLISDDLLKKKGIDFFQINRGGDMTYHGPGQIVGYPIFDLDTIAFSPKEFIFGIESVIIRVLKNYGIFGTRIENATGVWLDANKKEKARKIAAIGMRIHRKVTMHGFALNVNTDLKYFDLIVPCGIKDKGVTSIQKELGKKIDEAEVKQLIIKEMEVFFNARLVCK